MNASYKSNHSRLMNFWTDYHSCQRTLTSSFDTLMPKLFNAGVLIKKKNILEIGCGAGINIPIFAPLASEFYGCDISQNALDYAQNHHRNENVKFVKCSFEEVPLLDESFDLIILSKVFSTIACCKSQHFLIKNIQRLLRPSGKLLFLDFIYNTKYVSAYENCLLESKQVNILKPQWSSIDFVHYKLNDIDSLFFPLIKVFGMQHQILSCNGNVEAGCVSVFQKEGK